MQNILDALRLLLKDAASLQAPTKAAAVAAVLAPVIAAVAGVNISAAEISGYIVAAATVVATLERVFKVKTANAARAKHIAGR